MKTKVVAFYHFPDNSFVSTCRDVSRCGAWREDDQHIWYYNKKDAYKMTIIFKGPANEAERVRIVMDAGLNAAGAVQRGFDSLPQ